MASEFHFRWDALSSEHKELALKCLNGDTMDFVHVDPIQTGRGWKWLWLMLLSVSSLFLLFRWRLGDIEYLQVHSWLAPFAALSIVLALWGWFRWSRQHALPKVVHYPMGRYLLPVGWLDTTSKLWEFIPLRAMKDVQLHRVSIDSILIPIPTYRLDIELEGPDARTLSMLIRGEQLSEEVVHVAEHLIDDKEEALSGLKEYMDAFESWTSEASKAQSSPKPDASNRDSIERQLPFNLQSPLLSAIILGICISMGFFWMHQRVHRNLQIKRVSQKPNANVIRALKEHSTGQHRKRLGQLLEQRYTAAWEGLSKPKDARRNAVLQAMLKHLNRSALPDVHVRFSMSPLAALRSVQKLYETPRAKTQNKPPTTRPAAPTTQTTTRPVSRIRGRNVSKKQVSRVLSSINATIPPSWLSSFLTAARTHRPQLKEITESIDSRAEYVLQWHVLKRIQRAFWPTIPDDVMSFSVHKRPQVEHAFHLYAGEPHLVEAWSSKQQMRRLLPPKLFAPDGYAEHSFRSHFRGRLALNVRASLWPTGLEYAIRNSAKQNKKQKVQRLYGLGLVVQLEWSILSRRKLLNESYTVPPARWFGYKGKSAAIVTHQSERGQGYNAMLLELVSRWGKQFKKRWTGSLKKGR